ncbi:methyl-accepting chemotaxis protein [Enterocloster bolteae]|uniref:methyl-accepting chemotaxis protein n=1 Tax=Enterocloster bolteae TaxID=208479 RepID=UPI0020575625|nr:methyl-accepting chemotaxis protein [Enterocloster bolteae]MDU3289811.1 methyl-accepting chemotaxis protein [Enterocloster bolteae]DAX08324.1 MAG TPA: minor tail protein [Bacteriophage sp.]
MSDVIDDLKVQIDASTQSADAKLDKFIAKMMKFQSTITGLEMSNVSNIASGINQISASIQNFNNRTKTADFSRVATRMNKLATVDAQGVAATAQAMSTFAANMMGLNDVHVDSDGISNIANAISKLGRATVTEATQNLEFLKTSMKDFITGMNGAGSLTFDANGLVSLVNSVSRLGSTNATQSVKNLPQISTALRGFITSMNTVGSVAFDFAGLNNLVSNITRLGGAKATQAATNLKPIKDQILRFVSGLNGIGSLSFDTTNLANLVSSITKLGGKAATTAIPNIQALGTALTQLMATLSHAPAVSQNLIQMTTALASLAGNGSRVSSASTAMYRGLNVYSSSASRATKATKGLVSQIGMFYAKCFLLIRGAKALWKATESSMDYIETLNYFDAAWGQVAGNAAGEWKKAGYESAEAYAKSFSERAKALTGKMTGFQPDAYGNLIATGMPSLGLDPEKLMNYQATFGQMASSMGVASETALKLSNALTMIGADLASVKNLKFEDVWQDMASGMVGMSRTLDKYGVNIRNVNLQEKLYELGIDAKIAKLGQQDKALLRTIILLQSTKYAWGDMADTIGQPANQLRLLQANFANLARTIGNLLLPIVSKVLPYINALVIAIQRLFSWIGGLLGIKIGGFSSSVGSAATDFGDMEDAADGIADSTGDAAKNTKKMADNLQEFDTLNVINSQKDSGSGGSGSGGGAGGLLDDAFNDAFAEYQLAWDKAFANMENSAQELADKITRAFQRIWEAAEPTRESLKRLWNEGLARLGDFTWTALKDFWSEFLVPVGKWTLGTGLPMLVDNINAFLMKIDFPAINEALKNFWQALTPFSTKVGEGLIDFFGDLLSVGADFINFIVPNGINSVAEALRKISPDTAEKIGYALGVVATGIMGFKTVDAAVKGVKNIYSPLQKLFKLVGPMKYVAIAGGIAGLVFALDKFGVIDVNWSVLATGFKNLASALGKFVSGIGQGLINFIKGITPIVSPTLETLINGIGNAFNFMAGVLNSIPKSVIEGLTQAFMTFFMVWKTYSGISSIMDGITTALKPLSGAFQTFRIIMLESAETGSIIDGITYALGPSALGGIAFTAIAGGILLIAQRIMRVTDEAAKSSAIGQFSQALSDLNDEVSQKTNQINTSLDNTRNAVETAGVAEAQVARDLAKEYNELSDKASLSAGEKERLKQVSDDLVDIIPNLSKYIDDETGYLDIQKESLDAVIQGYESLAQKQAAQEYLVEAYKNQYEAQNNVNKAIDEYNKAFDNYLKQAGIAPEVIKQIADGQLDINQAYVDFQNSPNAFAEKYGVQDVATLKKALEGLRKETEEYNINLKNAKDTQEKAEYQLDSMKSTIDECTQKEKEAIETEKAGILASNEYKQSLRDLNTEFSNLDLNLSEDFMQNLALDKNFDITPIQEFFKSLAEGVQASGSEVQSAFESLGLSLPKELANAIAKMEPEAQTEVTKMLMQIKSGAEVQTPEIKSLFEKIGYDLPDAIVKNFSEKEPTVQNSTMDLLAGIQNGHSLTEGHLIELFAGLGVKVPEALIEQLGDSKTSAEVQAKAVELLAQISSAEESERPGLIEKLKTLGIDGADSLAEGIKSGQSTVETETKNLAGAAKTTMNNEFNPNDKGVGSLYDAGANASKGFWQGMKDWWDDSWLGRKVDELKETVTGKRGLDEHSPSKIMGQYGAFAGIGFNNEFSAEMDKTVPMIEHWIDSMKSTLSGYHIAFPGSNFTYTLGNDLLNQYAMAPKVSLPSFNTGSINMDYTAELTASLKDSNAELLYELKRNNDLLEQLVEKPVIDENGIYNATRRGVSRHFAQTGKTGFKGID